MLRAPAPELLDRVRALPAARPFLEALTGGVREPVFLVGGAVRDLLGGGEPYDLDIAVEGPIESLVELLGGRVANHDRFATATLVVNGVCYDVAQTRAERYIRPGALPEVRPATIEEDINRRDFTVNAMALGLTGRLAEQLITTDGALRDLEHRRLAVLHEASFSDDPTRILRMVRYQARLGFEISPGSRALARATLAAGGLAAVSGARIGNELRLLAREPDPVAGLSALHELGADTAIDPELRFDSGRTAIASRALAALPPTTHAPQTSSRRELLPLAAALLDTPHEQVARLLDRLEFTATDRDAIVHAATEARSLADRAGSAHTGSEIGRAIGAAGVETVAVAIALLPPDQSRGCANLRRWLTDLRERTLQITGDDLLASGIPEGPVIGRALAAARDAMLDDLAPDRETQLEVALSSAQ